jgi:hypothetical protein
MDIDIDFKTTFEPVEVFEKSIKAAIVRDGDLIPHNSGVYLQHMEQDPVTKLAAIPYKEAEDMGFYKLDCLHLNSLDKFESKAELKALMHLEPDWSLLCQEDVVRQLPQIHNKFDVVKSVKPTSIMELADVIALIRPSKLFILNTYTNGTTEERETLRELIYSKPDDGATYFKKGHAIAYAYNIVIELNLIG